MAGQCLTSSALCDSLALADNRVVIDASAAIHGSLIENALLGWTVERFAAPTLIWSEVASGLSQIRWRGEISDDELTAALVRFRQLPIDSVPSADLMADAIALAHSMGWAKTYDAEYVVLAERIGVPLLTIDARLRRSVEHRIAVVSPDDLENDLEEAGTSRPRRRPRVGAARSVDGRSAAELTAEPVADTDSQP